MGENVFRPSYSPTPRAGLGSALRNHYSLIQYPQSQAYSGSYILCYKAGGREGGSVFDLLMMVMAVAAFVAAAGYVSACEDLTSRQNGGADRAG